MKAGLGSKGDCVTDKSGAKDYLTHPFRNDYIETGWMRDPLG